MRLDLVEAVFPLAHLYHTKRTKFAVCRDTSPIIEGSVLSDLRFGQGNIGVSLSNTVLPETHVPKYRGRVCQDASRLSQNYHQNNQNNQRQFFHDNLHPLT